jgi:hypothetical protein
MTSSDIKPESLPFDEIVRRVLESVPPDGSPVFSLLPEIWAAPQALTPEKSDSFVPYLRQIRILPSVGKFILSASERFISVSEGALNLLWCASYAAWFIYQAYVDAQKNDLPSVQLGKDPEAVTLLGKREDGGKRLPFDLQKQLDEGYISNFFGRSSFELKLTHQGRRHLEECEPTTGSAEPLESGVPRQKAAGDQNHNQHTLAPTSAPRCKELLIPSCTICHLSSGIDLRVVSCPCCLLCGGPDLT